MQLAYAQDYYLIELKPKTNTTNYLTNPLQMLSERALNRRTINNISLDVTDVPINPNYIQIIKSLDLDYIGSSKWLNTIMVAIDNQTTIEQLQNLNFVENVESLVRNPSAKPNPEVNVKRFAALTTDFNYGNSSQLIDLINLSPLHQAGFTGQNRLIGVIDTGYPVVNINPQYESLRAENRIIDTYNFINNNSVYNMNSHGSMVLSTMAAKSNGDYIGTAPDASYALYVTEDISSETPKELLYWIQAAERADSVGVDIINTSLGYTTFDDPRYDYTYQDMNGFTTLISKGAAVAASKGIFLINAIGNDGNNTWQYLAAPADVPTVFSVGAVSSILISANF